MANEHVSRVAPASKIENSHWARRLGSWLFEQSGHFWLILAFLVIAGLMGISLAFNYSLGEAQGADPTSTLLLPRGYAGLDIASIVLLSAVATFSGRALRKAAAIIWATFLVSLSLWAAFSFTLMTDEIKRRDSLNVDEVIQEKKTAIEQAQSDIDYWAAKKSKTIRYKQMYQDRQNAAAQVKDELLNELQGLRADSYPPALTINYRVAALLEDSRLAVDAGSIATTVRLLFSAALTLTPIILVTLLGGLVGEYRPTKEVKHAKKNLTSTGNPCKQGLTSKSNLPNNSNSPDNNTKKTKRLGKSGPGKADTAVSGPKSVRYQTLKKLVQKGELKPSIPGMKRGSKQHFDTACNQNIATSYLKAMAKENLIVRQQNGSYRLAPNNSNNTTQTTKQS